jgi:hypothetical protein
MMKQSQGDMNSLHESMIFDMTFRGTSNNLSSVKIYTNQNSFQIERQVSFDSEYEQITSLEYFAGSVLSSILLTFLEQSKKWNVMIEEMEGVLNLSLENPLSLVGVRGYDEEPFIRKVTVTVYLFAELEDRDFEAFCFNVLKKDPLYNTLKRAMELEVLFKKIV